MNTPSNIFNNNQNENKNKCIFNLLRQRKQYHLTLTRINDKERLDA